MTIRRSNVAAVFIAVLTPCVLHGADMSVFPESLSLNGPLSSAQLIVSLTGPDGLARDVTAEARLSLEDPDIVTISEEGTAHPVSDGETTLTVQFQDQRRSVRVVVTGQTTPPPAAFQTQVMPVLSRLGCNSGSCHGKAEGQAGFKLSVFGFDPLADYEAIVKQNRGRRINRVIPSASLILKKATGTVPHEGGQRTTPSALSYRTLHNWLSEGAMLQSDGPAYTALKLQPESLLLDQSATHRLRVVATMSDGSELDVTHLAEFQSNAENVVSVDRNGVAVGKGVTGEATILARFMQQIATCEVTLPRIGTDFQRPPENNFVDGHVWDKLERLGIQPAPLADDATFLRRVFLDTIGTLPTAVESRTFLSDSSPTKRVDLIEALLQREEYAIYQAMKWADLLRIDSNALGPESAVGFTRWLRTQFRENRPYDRFARDIITARGNTQAESPAALYTTLNKPKELGSSFSQLFLGVRINCAECHHHPFEKWSQEDFYAFAGLFTSMGQKNLPGGSKAIIVKSGNDLKHPRTNLAVPARGLGQTLSTDENFSWPADRRTILADWITDDSNPYFARVVVNRIWASFFFRGLVDPVDDLRVTNPASNPRLLDALEASLKDSNYDLKQLTRTILQSRTYQLASVSNESNRDDQQNFSHAAYRPMPAEVLLDAICQVTAVPEKFNGWPIGARAIEVWDNRMPSYFFRIFGRPTRTTVCACERGDAPSISQALHLLNSPEISRKIGHRRGTVRRLADSELSPAEIIDELYLTAVCRYPLQEERILMLSAFEDNDNRRQASEDILWTLLNSREFLFNH